MVTSRCAGFMDMETDATKKTWFLVTTKKICDSMSFLVTPKFLRQLFNKKI